MNPRSKPLTDGVPLRAVPNSLMSKLVKPLPRTKSRILKLPGERIQPKLNPLLRPSQRTTASHMPTT